MELYKEYKLLGHTQLDAVKNFLSINASGMAKQGKPIHVIITTAQNKRNSQQNKRYWGYLLKHIADNAWVDGRKYSSDTWHEFFARKYGICEDIDVPGGEIIVRRKSTTKMTVSEFAKYMQDVELYSITELGMDWNEVSKNEQS